MQQQQRGGGGGSGSRGRGGGRDQYGTGGGGGPGGGGRTQQQQGQGRGGGQQQQYRGGGGSCGGGGYDSGGQQQQRRMPYGQRGGGRPQSRGEEQRVFQQRQEQQDLPQRLVQQQQPLPTQMQAFQSATRHLTTAPSCPPPMPAATQLDTQRGICSVYTLKVAPGRKAYRYDVDIWRLPMPKRNGQMDGGKNLAKGADDGQKALHRNLCFELMTIAFGKTKRFGMPAQHELVYDCKSTMYTSCALREFDVDGGQVIEIGARDINPYVRTYCGGENGDLKFTVAVRRNPSVPELDLNDYSAYQRGNTVFNEDHSLRTFFEMAISQYAINNELFVQVGAGKLFEYNQREPERVGNGIVLRSGLVKGVRIIRNGKIGGGGNGTRNGNGGPKAAVVLDAKTSAFFEPQPLIYTVLNILPRSNNKQLRMQNFSRFDWDKCNKLIEDLRVEVDYKKSRTFQLGHLTDRPISEIILDVERQGGGGAREQISMPMYFKRRYNIELQYPNLPGIHPNNPVRPGQKPEVFPLEVLNIMEDQRVPLEKMDSDLSATLLSANSLKPWKRMEEIQRRANQLGLFHDKNPVLCAFGISVDQKSNQVVIGLRVLPRIQFATGRPINPDSVKGEWRRDAGRLNYMEACELENWLILCSQQNIALVQQFANRLVQMGGEKGVSLAEPEVVPFRCSENNDRDWTNTFEQSAKQNVQFIMLIDPKRQDTHGLLKLYEVMYKPLVTQHVTFEKARDVVQKNQRQTLENILNKVNMKNFGLNYVPLIEPCGKRFALENGNILAIGYDVSHPAPMRAQDKRRLAASSEGASAGGQSQLTSLEPSVVGICANMTSNPHAFVGDYFYQESRREALDMGQLSQRMVWILNTLARSRPKKCRPEYIFILRDGLSEGQFAMACKEELAAIRDGCAEFDAGYRPKFVLIVGTKRHFKKFFVDNGGRSVENLPPGSVIQDHVVRADLTEFYLQPHTPLQGTGKPVEYALLENEPNASLDEIQAFLMSLCYSHQIVNIAISLPEPVYQADELAKRGRNNFAAFKKFYAQHMPRVPVREGSSVQMVNYRAIGEKLSYWGNGTAILSHRFTA